MRGVVYHKRSCEGNMREYLDRVSGKASGAKNLFLVKLGCFQHLSMCLLFIKLSKCFGAGVFGDLTLWNS